jgi:hypothetical protein
VWGQIQKSTRAYDVRFQCSTVKLSAPSLIAFTLCTQSSILHYPTSHCTTMSGDTGETTPNEEDGVMVMPIGRDVSVFDAGQVTQFTNDEKLLINLSWGSSSSSSADVDLDLSACLFDHQVCV